MTNRAIDYRQPFASLEGQVCVITGGAGVIGRALAEACAAVGISVALLGRDGEKAEKVARSLAEQYGVPAIGRSVDVLDKGALEAARESIEQDLGPVQHLVNCAGGNHPEATASQETILQADELAGSFFDLTETGIDAVFRLNFQGSLLPTQVFAAGMVARGAGNVVNISSVASFLPLTKVAGYSAAKAAINNLTAWLAAHFAPQGVRVNAIAPGFFLTDQNYYLLKDQATDDLTPRGHQILRNTPLGRFGEVEELGGTLLYLISPLARFVTGEVARVDGGFTAFGRV